MQIVHLERGSFDLFCPVTGRPVLDENNQPIVPTFRGWFRDELFEEPPSLCPELQELWEAYTASQKALFRLADPEEFLRSVDRPLWVAFGITLYEEPLRQMWMTNWMILDLAEEIQDGWQVWMG